MQESRVHSGVFEPVRAHTTFEETVARLGQAIRLGVLEPGTRLPPERDLATRLAISRSTLRQAITTLVETGHLVSLRGRTGGTFVADRPPLSATSPDAAPPENWRCVLDTRLSLELGVAALAAERGHEAMLDRLDSLVETMAGAEDFFAYHRADVHFHLTIADAADSPRLIGEMTELQAEMTDLLAAAPHPPELLAHSNEQHRGIVEALRARDVTRVLAEVRAHCRGTEQILGAFLV